MRIGTCGSIGVGRGGGERIERNVSFEWSGANGRLARDDDVSDAAVGMPHDSIEGGAVVTGGGRGGSRAGCEPIGAHEAGGDTTGDDGSGHDVDEPLARAGGSGGGAGEASSGTNGRCAREGRGAGAGG